MTQFSLTDNKGGGESEKGRNPQSAILHVEEIYLEKPTNVHSEQKL